MSGFTQPALGQQIEPEVQAAAPLQLQIAAPPCLMQTSPSLHAAPSHTHRCEVVSQVAPDTPFAPSHWLAVLQPQLPAKQLNLESRPPCEPQLLPHAPQFVAPLLRLVSHPSSGTTFELSLQLPKPSVQVGAQLPAVQVVAEALVVAHERLHLPQCKVSPLSVREVSQPLVVTLSQLPQPGEVQLMPHAPVVVHAAVALGCPPGHAAQDVVELQP